MSVLAVLNFYSSINLEQLKNLGADFIIKPFTKEELKQKVEFLLGKKKNRQSLLMKIMNLLKSLDLL